MAAIKQGVRLKQTQTLSVTPQMQQRLKLLQCNHMALEAEIAQMLDSNIMLEHTQQVDAFIQASDAEEPRQSPERDSLSDKIPEVMDSDVEWAAFYEDSEPYRYEAQNHSDSDGFQEDWVADSPSFDALLESNIHLSPLNREDRLMAAQILTCLDEHYFLTQSHEKLAKKLKIDTHRLARIIDVIKHLEPAGVASRNIQECLLAQLHAKEDFTDIVGDAHDILTDYFSYIGKKNHLIKKRLRLNDRNFDSAMRLIRTLSPYPRPEDHNVGTPIVPDVFVHQKMELFYASSNQNTAYDLNINAAYAALIPQCQGDEKNYMRAQLRMAKFFLKALDQRNKTILRVSNAIVMHQQDYFSAGEKALKPLLIKDIAAQLDLAESTVSRAVSEKYMSFNQRLIALRYFFSNPLSTKTQPEKGGGLGYATKVVKVMMKDLIDNETPQKPLSDSRIVAMLDAKGIHVSRRTVAKYRESMAIPPTSQRKRRF